MCCVCAVSVLIGVYIAAARCPQVRVHDLLRRRPADTARLELQDMLQRLPPALHPQVGVVIKGRESQSSPSQKYRVDC